MLAAVVAQTGRVEFYDYDASTGTFTNAVRECALVTSETSWLNRSSSPFFAANVAQT